MSDQQVKRRLAAILAADVVGYSRLMGISEVATLAALKSHRKELVDGKIAEHQGRIVKLTGDGMLVEFQSVVNAVACAVDIQCKMRERNAAIPQDQRIEFRIGVNLGDVITEDDDIFGDGVNIASRIEGSAMPGGIAVSAMVRENVGNRLELVFDDLGEQTFKNIERPVRVYHIVLEGVARRLAAAVSAAHDRQSIAVLPFVNMSGDPEQEYFSDGITEDIITDLSKIKGLSVTARNSVFTYKGKAVKAEQAARELGVKYLLEGSVRKSGQRVRITGQLIDGSDGLHIWAERYDRDLTDIFAIQDEITHRIVDQLRVRLMPEEKKAIAQGRTDNVEAYTYYLRGRQFVLTRTKSYLQLGRRMFAKAVELDPLYARAYAGMANCDSLLKSSYGIRTPAENLLVNTDKALALDPNLAEAHAAQGVALAVSERRSEARASFERAIELDPNCFEAHYFFARFCFTEGDYKRAEELYLRAIEIDPDDYLCPLHLHNVYESLGRKEDGNRWARVGLEKAELALTLHPESSRPAQLGAPMLAALGEFDRAKDWVARALAIDPDDNNVQYNAACTYALLGEVERAIDILEQWLPKVGPDPKRWFKNDTDLDPIRSHPRYQRLLELSQQ